MRSRLRNATHSGRPTTTQWLDQRIAMFLMAIGYSGRR
jgi:hypothetical protein